MGTSVRTDDERTIVHLEFSASRLAPTSGWHDVLPAPRIVAEVPIGRAPTEVPDALVPFVVERPTRRGADWTLTADFVAAGPPGVAAKFLTWRATWTRSFVLDPMPSLLALAELFDDGRTAHEWTARWAASDAVVVRNPLDLLLRLGDAHRRVVAGRRQGIGIIDASPGDGSGRLTRAWPSCRADVICATDELQVVTHPTDGLCVVRISEVDHTALTNITEVALLGDAVHVHAMGRTESLTLHTGRPLAWLAPGATRWMVRSIPEAVVWAKTFHRLRAACILSADHDLTLELRLGMDVAGER